MHIKATVAALVTLSCLSVEALPSMLEVKRGSSLPDYIDDGNHFWRPQQPGDRRSPCPGLNTLANHGYLPRDGRFITRNNLSLAFSQGWGVAQSVIATPTENAFTVCEIVNGKGNCPDTFDLSDLNEPDTFEHDHSMSREDYNRLYAVNSDGSYGVIDNHSFNRTIFGDTFSVMRGNKIMSVADAEEVRLQREHLAYIRDPRDTFKENRLTMLTEIGFVFSVMRNFAGARNGVGVQQPNTVSDQSVQLDWWNYWFTREQFPTELGWRKPVPDVVNSYVTSIRSSVFSAAASSTPSPLPADATKSPTVVPLRGAGKRAEPTGDGGVIGITNAGGGILSVPASLISAATSAIATVVQSPPGLAPYDIVYDYEDLSAYKSSLTKYENSLKSAIESVASKAGITASTPAAVEARATSA